VCPIAPAAPAAPVGPFGPEGNAAGYSSSLNAANITTAYNNTKKNSMSW